MPTSHPLVRGVEQSYLNYVNELVDNQIDGTSISDAKKSGWHDYLKKQGTLNDFNIDNVRDKPTYFERFKSWIGNIFGNNED